MVIAMGKKKKSLIGILLLFLALLLIYILGSFNTVPTTSGTPDSGPNVPSGSTTETTTETPSESLAENQHTQSQTSGEASDNSQLNPPGPTFVVPESPLGTLGIISAFALAFGIFAHKK